MNEYIIVGNAAFHSRELYSLLSVCIDPLSVALKDSDEKTRANAAGAIGNLIRNGSELCDAMVKAKVPQMLMSMIISDSDITPQVVIFTM